MEPILLAQILSGGRDSSLTQRWQQKTWVVRRYGSKDSFLSTFGVSQQTRHTADPMRCVNGSAPTVIEVNNAYGAGTAEAWLIFQLGELSEFAGARDKLSAPQIRQLASLIVSEYYWLKVTEIELFIRRLKLGRYGRFYGTVDPMVITEQLRVFLRERAELIDMYEQEQARAKRETQYDKEYSAFGKWLMWSMIPPTKYYLMPFHAPKQKSCKQFTL